MSLGHQFEWVGVEPGQVTMGSDVRSVMFGGVGPRHEASVGYSFRISKTPVPPDEATRMIESGEAELASESEWELAHSRGLLSAEVGAIESLADRAQDYWGKACDGRPHYSVGAAPQAMRRWSSRGPAHLLSFPGQGASATGLRLVARESPDWAEDPPRLPSRGDTSRKVLEEALICLVIGVIPSFVWAFFNAREGYIREGWLNLVLGGVFVGVLSGVFWRPRQPTWRIEAGRMSPGRRN